MYVADHAREGSLYLTYPIEIYDRGVGVILGKPSRFVADLDEALLEPIALVDERRRNRVPRVASARARW
jgi:hypothetical protein